MSRESVAILDGCMIFESHISLAFSGSGKRGLPILTIRKHRAAVSKKLAANLVNAVGLKTGPLLSHMSAFLNFGRECSYSLRSENRHLTHPPLSLAPLR